jgi:N-acetylglucosaminyldiphosphoundecaprenol N-acetyl-beta-D-mannosaminyltransferase
MRGRRRALVLTAGLWLAGVGAIAALVPLAGLRPIELFSEELVSGRPWYHGGLSVLEALLWGAAAALYLVTGRALAGRAPRLGAALRALGLLTVLLLLDDTIGLHERVMRRIVGPHEEVTVALLVGTALAVGVRHGRTLLTQPGRGILTAAAVLMALPLVVDAGRGSAGWQVAEEAVEILGVLYWTLYAAQASTRAIRGAEPDSVPVSGRGSDVAAQEQARARVDVLGVGVSAISMDDAVREITGWITDGRRHYVCVTGVHGVMESQRDPDLLRIHNQSGLTTPDGMPLVWASRWAGAKAVDRVYGPDLMLELCALAAEKGWRSFFYGGREGVPEILASKLQARFPGLEVAGTYSPPFRALTPEEDAEIVERINAARPDLVWIGLSTPKQERWMDAHVGTLSAPVLLGVGAAFDIHAGTLAQAPRWMQRSGTEWLYRLLREPRRLWRRYFSIVPRFVVAVLRRKPYLRELS